MPRKAPNPLPQDETGYQHFKNLPGRNNRDPALTAWYDRDAKLGLFIHWGIYSVPGWASTQKSVVDFLDPKTDWKTWFSNNAYSEWYLHTIRIEGSPAQKHHEAVFGKDYEYYEFAKPFNDCVAKSWKPEAWSDLFARSGFRYVVLTTKHHDGFTLFPSDVPNPNMPKGLPKVAVDIVGKLTDSVRKSGMEMGLYYSGGFDWSFDPRMDARCWPQMPPGADYAKYCDSHLRELIMRYKPAVLWNDIAYPHSPPADLDAVFGEYYSCVPHGIVNDRFFPIPRIPDTQLRDAFQRKIGDITCPEYASYPKALPRKWETCRGISHSFAYNSAETEKDQIGFADLIHSLVDISSKNGNLLLGIGPRADGSIPLLQRRRLGVLGQWLSINGQGIYGTSPWWDGEAEGTIEHVNGKTGLRAVTKDRSEGLYVIYMGVLGDAIEGQGKIVGLPKLAGLMKANPGAKVELLAAPVKHKAGGKPWEAQPDLISLNFKAGEDGSLTVEFPSGVASRIAVDVPITRPGDSTGVDTPDEDERTEKKVLAFTLRVGPFADVESRL